IAQTDLASPGDGIYPARQADSYSKWTWHVGDELQFNPHTMAYVKADTGYRAGFFNLYVPTTGPSYIQPYSPEYVTSFEAGTKNRLLNGHLKFDADIFYMRYSGEQLLESNQGGVITVNAARTNIYGTEISFAEEIEPLGEFDLNLNWLHARFGHQLFTNAVGQTFDIGGNRLTQAPDVSLTAAYEHVFKMTRGSITARIETKYQSGQYFDFYNVPDSYQKPYTRTDAYLTYQTRDGRWSIGAFVRNIENSVVIVDESESFAPPLSNPGTYNVGFQAPRTFGIQVGAKL
ncbi:MAG: TonB-dependent receptor, partial [Sphingomonadales bacterium]|nr:TonB-dependent receptor [Sphingomonadales bacterium]